MLNFIKKSASAILITATAGLLFPVAAQAACQPIHCVNASQSSTRVSHESGVRVYRGTVYPQDYNSQIRQNAQRDKAAAAQALRDKRAAQAKAKTAEAKALKAEQALAASKSQKRTSKRRYRTYGSPYYAPRRRAYGANRYARRPNVHQPRRPRASSHH